MSTLSGKKVYAVAAVLVVLLYRTAARRWAKDRLPGPRGYPIIGNLLDIPRSFDATIWAKHKALYGPISSLSTLRKCIVILNDVNVAIELLDKRSSVYSDRPLTVFCGEMIGWGNTTMMLQHDEERFRISRKYLSKGIGSKSAVEQFSQILELETRRFLLLVLKRQQDLRHHVRTWAGASILKITYGYNIKRDGDDPLIDIINKAVREFSLAAAPGAWLVDMLPFLRYLPDWFPGTAFKQIARKWRQTAVEVVERPFAFVKAQMASGLASESFTSELLKESLSKEEEFIVKWTAEGLYAGGADTTVSVFYGFFLAMLLYPDVQKKAQTELDSIIGSDRLPCLADRENLPYVNALVKEILRWNTAVGLGLPHVASEGGFYKGYLIPKGAILIPNIWLFNHDSDNYRDPMSFKPERFLDNDLEEMDPYDVTFGFGRRICPGKELAHSSLFLAIAMSLAVFDIRKPLDRNGAEITPAMAWTDEVVSHPVEFGCQIHARSLKARVFIEYVDEEYPLQPSDAETLDSLQC